MRKPTKRRMKHAKDTQWVSNPTRERLAATRKRTLRRVPVRGARSVWSECQSRVIESRKFADCRGLPVCARGDSIAMHVVRRSGKPDAGQVRGGRPGSESRAKAYGGNLESWESRIVPSRNTGKGRHRKNVQAQGLKLSEAMASETGMADWERTREGNRSEWVQRCGSLSGLIVATENRETEPKGSL
jgi:hypothetical protein